MTNDNKADDNKALIRRFSAEVVNKGNLAALHDLVAPNMIDHNPMFGGAPGFDGVRQVFAMLHAAFPAVACSIEALVAEGDLVVERFRAVGIHSGWFKGIAPTGKEVTIHGIAMFRIADGKIVERWGHVDTAHVMKQLGVASH